MSKLALRRASLIRTRNVIVGACATSRRAFLPTGKPLEVPLAAVLFNPHAWEVETTVRCGSFSARASLRPGSQHYFTGHDRAWNRGMPPLIVESDSSSPLVVYEFYYNGATIFSWKCERAGYQ